MKISGAKKVKSLRKTKSGWNPYEIMQICINSSRLFLRRRIWLIELMQMHIDSNRFRFRPLFIKGIFLILWSIGNCYLCVSSFFFLTISDGSSQKQIFTLMQTEQKMSPEVSGPVIASEKWLQSCLNVILTI